MGKSSSCDENGLKKGAWTEDEDNKLRAYIQRYGHWNWSLLPKFAGVCRSGKSCRLRWMNYLRPNIKHGNFTEEEDNVIIGLHNKIGNKWSTIAAHLPGRSDNEIKNRWNTRLKKRVQNNQTVTASEHNGTIEPDQANPKLNRIEEIDLELQEDDEVLVPGVSFESPSSPSSTGLLSCWLSGVDDASSSDFIPQTFDASSSDLIPQTFDHETFDNFWTEPFFGDNSGIIPSSDNLWSPSNFVNDFIPQSLGQDMLMTDEFLWSTFDTYVEDNMETN